MDCDALVSLIESKYRSNIKPFGPEDTLSETDRLKYIDATSDFLKWMENTILNTPIDTGDETLPAKQCLLNAINLDVDETEHPDLWDSLALFSDIRLKEIFGVQIFADEEE